MDVQLEESDKKEVNLLIKDGDIGVLYIIQQELLKDPTTKFAGVITKHPLTNELRMRVDSTHLLKDIIKATDVAIKKTADLKKLVSTKLKAN
mgnify:FL=1